MLFRALSKKQKSIMFVKIKKRQTQLLSKVFWSVIAIKTYAGNVLGLNRGGACINTIHTESFTLKWSILTYCIAHGILLNVMWQPGWDRSLGKNGYMYLYGWAPLLSTWNYHNLVNQLCMRAQLLSHVQLCDPMYCSLPGSPELQYKLKKIFFGKEKPSMGPA